MKTIVEAVLISFQNVRTAQRERILDIIKDDQLNKIFTRNI